MTSRLFNRWTDAELEAAKSLIDAFAREVPLSDWTEDQTLVIHDLNHEVGHRKNQEFLAALRDKRNHD